MRCKYNILSIFFITFSLFPIQSSAIITFVENEDDIHKSWLTYDEVDQERVHKFCQIKGRSQKEIESQSFKSRITKWNIVNGKLVEQKDPSDDPFARESSRRRPRREPLFECNEEQRTIKVHPKSDLSIKGAILEAHSSAASQEELDNLENFFPVPSYPNSGFPEDEFAPGKTLELRLRTSPEYTDLPQKSEQDELGAQLNELSPSTPTPSVPSVQSDCSLLPDSEESRPKKQSFKILKKLGEGAHGTVYLVVSEGKQYVIKTISYDDAEDINYSVLAKKGITDDRLKFFGSYSLRGYPSRILLLEYNEDFKAFSQLSRTEKQVVESSPEVAESFRARAYLMKHQSPDLGTDARTDNALYRVKNGQTDTVQIDFGAYNKDAPTLREKYERS